MNFVRIVPAINEAENDAPGVASGPELMRVNAIGLDSLEKVLRHRIVPSISLARHGLGSLHGRFLLSKASAGILRAAIRMEDKLLGQFLLGHGPLRCGYNSGPIRQVQYDRQIVPLPIDLEVRDVADPFGCRPLAGGVWP